MSGKFRNIILDVHLYLSLGLSLLLVAIALTGAPLVWRDNVDRALNPDRYAITGASVDQMPSVYAAAAIAAAGPAQRVVDIRFPETPGWPVRVATRSDGGDGKAPRSLIVYLDPPTGKPLGVAGVSDTFVGVLHNFHHMLMVPQFSGRQIVGWVGVGMFILSLTGLYLWWPRNGGFLRGLRWRRAPAKTTNLHHLFGFWISLPLAIVSLTGVYLSFPRQAQALMSSLATVSGSMQHGGYGALPLQKTRLDADGALQLALEVAPGSRLVSIAAPVAPKTDRAENGHSHDAPSWRIRLTNPPTADVATIMVNDSTGAAHVMPPAASGDRAAAWIAWIHEGRRGGLAWEIVVFLTGVLPLGFLITGVIMWLRRRSARGALDSLRTSPQPNSAPAE